MRTGIIGATAAIIIAALTGAAFAQATDSYPDRPIKVVVPAAAGGVTDTPARIVANRMRDNLGQTLVIENQGGAGGILAAESVKRTKLLKAEEPTDWYADKGQSLYELRDLLEFKTTWHPIGA